jgi:hypothetical protein
MTRLLASVNFSWRGEKYTKAVIKEFGRRIKRSTEHLKSKVLLNISTPGDLIGPMPTAAEFPRAINNELRKKIYGITDQEKLLGRVGVSGGENEHWVKVVMALEFGSPEPIVIRPKAMKALKIPITPSQAAEIIASGKYHRKGKSGKVIKKGNSKRSLMKRAGIVTGKRGQLFILRKWVKRGPIRQKSFLRRTLYEEEQEIMKIMGAPLPEGISGSFEKAGSTGNAQIGTGETVPMWGFK